MKLLFATTNRGKLLELAAALRGLALETISLSDLLTVPAEPAETGSSFSQNALLKARYYAEMTGTATLADDSGLCVDALKGAPGVKTARIGRDDPERIAWVLERLRRMEKPEDRGAYFACALCLYFSADCRIEVEGQVAGRITREPRGRGGFGLDPIFYHPPSDKTFAELTLEEKNRLSHRAVALRKLRRKMEGIMLS